MGAKPNLNILPGIHTLHLHHHQYQQLPSISNKRSNDQESDPNNQPTNRPTDCPTKQNLTTDTNHYIFCLVVAVVLQISMYVCTIYEF